MGNFCDLNDAIEKTANDADRLRKHLTRFGLDWSQLQALFTPPQES